MRSGALVLALIVTTSLVAAPKRRAATPDRCKEIVAPASLSFPSTGGSAAVTVNVSGGCTWSPVVSDSWISATQTAGGISVTAAPNTATTARTALIHVRSTVIVVTQDATTNLVQNGSFDSNIDGWSNRFSGGGSAGWSGGGGIIVAPPSTPQGVAVITSTQPNAGYQLAQCVNINPSTRYEAGTKAFIPSGQASGVINFGVFEYWVPNCDPVGTFRSMQVVSESSPIGQWFDNPITWTSNLSAKSVLVIIGAGGSPNPPFTAYFDDVYVRPAQ